MYLNGKRIDPDKWQEVKVKDQLCFGTPISNNSFRYILEQLPSGGYQLVQEEFVAEAVGNKKKPNEADLSEKGPGNGKKEESDVTNSNSKGEAATGPSVNAKRNEMLSSMQEEFLCVICQELFVKAHSLSCSHSYCEKCISDWMKGNKHCPMCRKTIEGKPVPSIALDNAISKLVECLPEEAQKERAELLKERSSIKIHKKDIIFISDSPVRPGSSGVVTRSVTRRNIPVNLVSSDSDSELSSSQLDDDDSERYLEIFNSDDLEGYEDSYDSGDDTYTGLPGYSWGGYGHCYRCGECPIKLTTSHCLVHSTGDPGHWAPGCPN